MKHFIIVDGASSGNGISAGIGVVIKNDKGETIGRISNHVGKLTNNEAEYAAVIAGLRWAKDNKLTDVVILTDSNLVHAQIKGRFSVKGVNLRELLDQVKKFKGSFKTFEVDYVPREYTHEADELARAASEQGVEKEVEKKYPFLTYKKS